MDQPQTVERSSDRVAIRVAVHSHAGPSIAVPAFDLTCGANLNEPPDGHLPLKLLIRSSGTSPTFLRSEPKAKVTWRMSSATVLNAKETLARMSRRLPPDRSAGWLRGFDISAEA